MRNLIQLFLCLAALPLIAAENKKVVTVSRFKKAPVVDGKLSPGEWDAAVGTAGFQDIKPGKGGVLEARTGRTYCGFTDDRLYIAVVSEMPPDGKLYANQTNRDSNVIFDEGIEIWIDPNRPNRAAKTGDQSFYQFIGNAIGTIYDVRFDPVKGTPDVGWNGAWEYRNSVDRKTHMWTAELSLPFADLGWEKGKPVGRELGVLLARNFKRPWAQATWFTHRGAFASWTEYPCLVLSRDKPSVQISGLGEKVHLGELHLSVRLANPGPAREAKVVFKATSSDMPGIDETKTIKLPAGGAGAYEYRIPPGRFHSTAKHAFRLTVTDAQSGEQYFAYSTKWQQAPEKRWHVRVGPNPGAAVKLAFYPSFNLLKLKIDTKELDKKAEAVKSARAVLTNTAGKVLLNEPVTWAQDQTGTVHRFKIPDLPDGEYRLDVKLDGYGMDFVRTFRRIHFPWEGNKLGITNRIYPPFQPIKVDGKTTKVVLREYGHGRLGMWDSVKALDKEILAGPIVLKTGAGEVVSGSGKITKTQPHATVYEGSGSAPGVRIASKCTTEYDGCMKVELTLTPPPAVAGKQMPLNKLWLDIPLKDEVAPLWHISTSGLRLNPVGAVPKGEGDIWDSTKFPDGNWYGNFKCYAWLGGPQRGICWFADNDNGWVLNVDKKTKTFAPCLVLNRADGVLTLRVNLIQKPTIISKPRKIVFGLMASPAKPMMKGWRRILYNRRHPGYENFQMMGSEYWGADENCSAKYPRNGDLSILDKMHEVRLTGNRRQIKPFLELWSNRNLAGDIKGTSSKTAEQMRFLARVSLDRMANRPDYQSVYWEEFHSTSWHHKETPIFQNEWSGNYGYGSTGGLVRSYQDFACWYGAQFLRRGLGLYFDNAFPKRAYDPLTTNAYVMDNGRIQPSAGMWAHREYLKRIWILHQQLRTEETKTLMMIHMTNTHLVPLYSFNETNLDLEWFYGPEPQQSKYPHAMLRAQSMGLQSGNIPYALARVDKTSSKEEKRIAERTRFGVLFTHEIKAYMPQEDGRMLKRALNFGYGMDDCAIYNYWAEDCPIKAGNDDIKFLLMKRGKDLLLVVCTWNPKPEKATLTLDLKALGVTPKEAVNEEKPDEKYAWKDGKLELDLVGYDVKMIRLK